MIKLNARHDQNTFMINFVLNSELCSVNWTPKVDLWGGLTSLWKQFLMQIN